MGLVSAVIFTILVPSSSVFVNYYNSSLSRLIDCLLDHPGNIGFRASKIIAVEHQYKTHYKTIKIYNLNHNQYQKEYEIECRNEYGNDQAEEEGEKYRELLLDREKNGPEDEKNGSKHSVNEEK